MAVSAVSKDSEGIYTGLVFPDQDVYSTLDYTSPNSPREQHQERSVRSSHPYRRAAVCLGLLCALLLTATLVLCVLYTSQYQTYLLLERELEELSASNSSMIQERDQLQRDNTILKEERNQLETNYTRLKTERDQLQRDNTILKEERNQLETNYTRLKTERDQLQRDNSIFQQAVSKKLLFIDQYCPISLRKRECEPCPRGWEQFNFKCYYFSNESKNWTESRNDCIKRGADLVIIESQKEQDFISRNVIYSNHWIGLSDSVTNGTWLWVDGSALQGGFWERGQPNNQYWIYSGTLYQGADCVVTAQRHNGWINTDCKWFREFICETDALLP